MKAISLWQPHALAIAVGLKPYETRGWNTKYRGPLAIHAGKRRWTDSGPWHDAAVRKLVSRIFPSVNVATQSAMLLILDRWIQYGAVICIVDIVECIPTSRLRGAIPSEHEFWGDFSDGAQGEGRYAWRLENVRLVEPALPWRGEQGFFEVDVRERKERPLSLFGDAQ